MFEKATLELILSVVLTLFSVAATLMGFAFRNWATTVRETSRQVLKKLEQVAREIHDHRLDTERRLTRVETEVEHCVKLLDDQVSKKMGNDTDNT